MPFFSVVIPCFNKEDYIGETLDCVLNQTYTDFEVIVVDDGSEDKSIKVISNYNDERIKIISQVNSGVSKARNTGIEYSKGNYIAFIDADDLWESDHLLKMQEMISKYPNYGLYCSRYSRIYDGKKISSKFYNIPPENGDYYIVNDYFTKCTFGDNIAWTSAVVVPKKILTDIGGFPMGINRGEDKYVWAIVALYNKVVLYNRTTACYRVVKTGLTGNKQYDIHWVFEDYMNRIDRSNLDVQVLKSIDTYIASRKLNFVIPLIRQGQYQKSKEILLDTLKYKKLRTKTISKVIRLILWRA